MHFLKYILLLTALDATSYFTCAQSNEAPASHFSFGISTGLTEDYWNGNNDYLSIDGVTASTDGNMGYTINASVAYAFGRHLKLRVSPGIQKKKLEYRLDGLYFLQDFNGTGFNSSHAIYHARASALTVPLNMEYIFGTKKILPFISLGIAGELVLKQTCDNTIYYANGNTELIPSDDLLRNTNLALMASAGIYYRASDKLSFSLSPMFSYTLLEDFFNLHQYSFGASMGLLCSIR